MFWVPHFLCQFSFVVGNEPASCFFNCLHKVQADLCHKIYMKSMPFLDDDPSDDPSSVPSFLLQLGAQ